MPSAYQLAGADSSGGNNRWSSPARNPPAANFRVPSPAAVVALRSAKPMSLYRTTFLLGLLQTLQDKGSQKSIILISRYWSSDSPIIDILALVDMPSVTQLEHKPSAIQVQALENPKLQ